MAPSLPFLNGRGQGQYSASIDPKEFATLTMEYTNQLAFAAIEYVLSEAKGGADRTAALRILDP
jgi:hypothetical protein